MTIQALVIDNDIMTLEALGRMLAVQGANYVGIQDAGTLNKIIARGMKFDVVFLNAAASEALPDIRQLFGDVPVVACTGDHVAMDTARQRGFHSFLGKPLDRTRFSRQFKQIIKNQPVWEY